MLFQKMRPFLGDEDRLLQRMAGRLDLWEECVLLFPREEIIKEMDRALEDGALSVLYSLVHRLKGNLANFGFDHAANEAMNVLAAIKEEEIGKLDLCYRDLREEYLQIIERLGDDE